MIPRSSRAVRDLALFMLGAGGFAHEVLSKGAERPTILFACLALMGVPIFLKKDANGKNGNGKGS